MEQCWPRRHYTHTHTHTIEKKRSSTASFISDSISFIHLRRWWPAVSYWPFWEPLPLTQRFAFTLMMYIRRNRLPPLFHSLLDTLIALSIHAERLSLIPMTKDQTNQPRGKWNKQVSSLLRDSVIVFCRRNEDDGKHRSFSVLETKSTSRSIYM
jgi:hypothetical protein